MNTHFSLRSCRRCLGLVSLLFVLAPVSGARELYVARNAATLDVSADGLERVVIENPVGRLTVLGRRDAEAVVVEAERSIGATVPGMEKAATERLEEFRVLVERVDEFARVSVIVPRDLPEELLAKADLQVTIPRGAELVVTAGDGAVRLLGVTGAAEVRTIGGDVQSRRGGALDVFSADGDIDVRQVDGELALRSTRGEIKVRLDDPCSAEIFADDGDVHLELAGSALDAAVHASTRKGSVRSEVDLLELKELDVSKLETQVTVRTDRGHIRITSVKPATTAPVPRSSVSRSRGTLTPVKR